MRLRKPRQLTLILLAAGLTVVVFVADLLTPLGYVHWLFYIVPLLVIYLTESTVATYLFLLAAALALAAGYLCSPIGRPYENIRVVSSVNRIAGFAALLIFTVVVNSLIQTRRRYARLAGELERANRELESFTYSVSHDLRNPLNNIGMMKDVLLTYYAGTLNEKGKRSLEQIGLNVDRMTDIISSLLELSRVSRHELRIEPIDLGVIAREIIDELRKSDPARRVDVRIQRKMIANVDPRLIRLVLENLIRNAWKFTQHSDQPVIEVGMRTAKDHPVYFVKDNGAGFDMQDARRIFSPFQRAHAQKEYPGSGIGLSIVERVIERHGGEIWAEAEVGKGACFCFRIP